MAQPPQSSYPPARNASFRNEPAQRLSPLPISHALERRSGVAAPAFLLAMLLFFPPALPFLVNAPSFLVGTVCICLLCLFAYVGGLVEVSRPDYFRQALSLAGLITLFVLAHLAVCYLFGPVALGRALQTIPIIIIFLAATPIVVSVVIDRSGRAIDGAVLIVLCCYLLSATMSIVGIQPPGFYGEKPTFPFSEPSFFAFTIAPVMIYFCVTRPFFWRWMAVGLMATFAVVVSNLTTLAASLLIMLTFARWWQIGGAMVVGYFVWPYVDQDYFLDRLAFNADTVNLTSLVYLQGWQLLDESLRNTYAWGLGLQQLGAGYTNTIASYRINQLMGYDVNLLDGGFLLAKVGSEFGVFGIAAVAAFTALAGMALWRLRAVAHGSTTYARPVILCYSSIVGSIIEVYLRGSTYFTGTMLLLSSAVLYLVKDWSGVKTMLQRRSISPDASA